MKRSCGAPRAGKWKRRRFPPSDRSGACPMPADTAPHARRILVVEDLEDSRQSLQELLQLGVPQTEVSVAEDGLRALEMLTERPYAVVLTDLRMPKIGGMRLLREIKERSLSCAVIIVTGHGGVREAVEAMRLG